jgi:hypothetical protein
MCVWKGIQGGVIDDQDDEEEGEGEGGEEENLENIFKIGVDLL